MVDLKLSSGKKSMKRASLSFRIPYYTQWGRSLLVCGSEPLLGSWDVKKGLALIPFFEGEELIWSGKVSVPCGFQCEYSYYLVDDNRNVLRWEDGKKRKAELPGTIKDGEVVELRDLWQTAAEAIFFRSAFRNVIFQNSSALHPEALSGGFTSNLDQEDTVIVHFKISCPRLRDDKSVYVIGSSNILGQWKVQDSLKLSYAGDSFWQADCAIKKKELPIKYPFPDIYHLRFFWYCYRGDTYLNAVLES